MTLQTYGQLIILLILYLTGQGWTLKKQILQDLNTLKNLINLSCRALLVQLIRLLFLATMQIGATKTRMPHIRMITFLKHCEKDNHSIKKLDLFQRI